MLVVSSPAGGEQSTITRTNNHTPMDVLPMGEIVFAQRDYTDRYRKFSDLYVATIEGSVRRVTAGARLTAPSAGPDGTWVVAVTEGGGTNGLARIDLADGAMETLVAPATGTYWAYPAVSPDGRWVAASRWTERRHDVVIIDAHGRVVHEVTRDRALDLAPDWSADGRHLVWSSDRTGILNVLAAEIDPDTAAAGPTVMLTNVRTGAAFPSVDPAGEWLYFSGYHVDGWEVERVRFAPDAAPPAPVPAARFDEVVAVPHDGGGTAAADPGGIASRGAGVTATPPPGGAESAVHRYSPWSTLYPRYWLPELRAPTAIAPYTAGDVEVPRTEVLGYALGGRTSGIDPVGRHFYDIGVKVFTSGGRGEGDVSYEYRGLGNPSIGVTASQTWDAHRIGGRSAGADGSPETFFALERERRLAMTGRIHRPGVRTSTSLRFSAGLIRSDREVLDDALRLTDGYRLARPSSLQSDYVVSFNVSSARSHAYQMGNARGVALYVRARIRDDLNVPDNLARLVGSDLSADDLLGRLRAYVPLPLPGFATPVLAIRASGGMARGPGAHSGYFASGGASGGRVTLAGLPSLGSDSVFFPVRGYETFTRSGRYAWSTTVELRVGLALVNRGLGAWPLHLDRIFGSAFLDSGNAWGRDASSFEDGSPRPRSLASVGFETSTDLLALYETPVRLRAGVAFPLVDRDGPRYYVRLGMPF